MRSLEFLLITAACSISVTLSRADTFTVTSTTSLGPGSLYEAILSANAHPGLDTIAFNLPGSGVRTINAGDNGLPEITDPVIIDGYTQPGAKANTLELGDNAVILVRIDGSYTSTPHNGFVISAGNCVVRGLSLMGFPVVFNGFTGEQLFDGTAIILQKNGGNLISGNFIGVTSVNGRNENSTGVSVQSSSNIIGGVLAADRNIISLNNVGVSLDRGANGNVVEGNYFGTDPSGEKAVGDAIAIAIDGNDNQIGGFGVAGNVISGSQYGVVILPSGSENYLYGNFIGTDASGTRNLANDRGVSISGSNNQIGGLESGSGNLIWSNLVGVEVKTKDSARPARRNSILSNRISSDIAIDLDSKANPDPGLYDGSTPRSRRWRQRPKRFAELSRHQRHLF